jgi:WD40 repeat protein
VPEFAGDIEATAQLVDIRDGDRAIAVMSRWRDRQDQALLIVDQFEELFTLNAEHKQRRFANLLGRLVADGDVHVLLTMRDDFLYRCHSYDTLRPVFDGLLPLEQPDAEGLYRALVEPARRHGFQFEDDNLPGEMIAEVEGERGALPLLAFAVARLWDRRNHGRRLLTRETYHQIGGVSGALAQHAETTIKVIGEERLPIVREIFRNLMTAEGTRALREIDELLSVFDESQRPIAEEVLRGVIDARLLTSYGVRGEVEEPTRRVEIIHESLLANWPRLVGWQTQDADSARLRDELRQAARTWDEHDRSDDLLWTGTAFREYQVWRERYPGGLTGIEEAFAQAMTSFAMRRRRRRRMAVAAAITVLLGVLGVVSVSRQQVVAEARRAEAQKLVALGRLELEGYPTAALAYATASLDLFDTHEARRLAVEALWEGPTLFVMEHGLGVEIFVNLEFSPDGQLLTAGAGTTDEVFVWSESGQIRAVLGKGEMVEGGSIRVSFSAKGEILASTDAGLGTLRFWSVPGLELIREFDLGRGSTPEEWSRSLWTPVRNGVFTATFKEGRHLGRLWPVKGGAPTVLGWWDSEGIADCWRPGPDGRFMYFTRGRDLFQRPLDTLESRRHDHLVGRHDSDVLWFDFSPSGDQIAAVDKSGETRVWSMDPNPHQPLRTLYGPRPGLLGPTGRTLVGQLNEGPAMWDLEGPPNADPLVINRPPESEIVRVHFHPSGLWFVASAGGRILLWPLGGPYPRVLSGHTGRIQDLAFVGNGTQLVSASERDRTVRLWPLSAESGESTRVVWEGEGISSVAADPTGKYLLVSNFFLGGRAFLVPIAEAESTAVDLWPTDSSNAWPVTFSRDGRRAAVGALVAVLDEGMVIMIWDLESGNEKVLALRDGVGADDSDGFHRGVVSLRFTPAGDLLSAGFGGIRRWDLETGEGQWIMRAPEEVYVRMDASRDRRFLLTIELPELGAAEGSNLTLHDLGHATSHRITSHGQHINKLAIDPTGTIVVTRGADGAIRVGSADGSEPHLLFGHEGDVNAIAVSPDSRWIATGGEDTTIRLWPMPDLSKPPLHTLPHDDLIAKLKTLTNLRAVRDEESPTGWKLELGPFPGWATVPEW